MSKKNTEFPEAEAWSAVFQEAQTIEDFLTYCQSQSVWLSGPDGRFPVASQQDLIYGFFGINAKKLEDERREMLRRMRQDVDAL